MFSQVKAHGAQTSEKFSHIFNWSSNAELNLFIFDIWIASVKTIHWWSIWVQIALREMIDSMVDSLIDSASQKRVHSKSQKRVHSKSQYWEYYRFRNDTNIGYIPNLKKHVACSQEIIWGYYTCISLTNANFWPVINVKEAKFWSGF